jgi:hypothetical protein
MCDHKCDNKCDHKKDNKADHKKDNKKDNSSDCKIKKLKNATKQLEKAVKILQIEVKDCKQCDSDVQQQVASNSSQISSNLSQINELQVQVNAMVPPTNMDPLQIIPNVIQQLIDPPSNPTIFFPSDSTMAVGPTSYICVCNTLLSIFNKANDVKIYEAPLSDFFQANGGDVQVIYDTVSNSFIVSMWYSVFINAECDIDIGNPASAFNPYKASSSLLFQGPYNVHAPIVATVPANADTPLTNSVANGNDLHGKIAFIQSDGFITGSVNKSSNAEAAGAIGCIFWSSNANDTGNAINGSTTIPCVIIDFVDGQPIADNIQSLMSGTIKKLNITICYNKFFAAKSLGSNPSSQSDFNIPAPFIPDPITNGNFQYDFPKIALGGNYFYWVTQDFDATDNFVRSNVFVFDRASLDTASLTLSSQHPLPNDSFKWPSKDRSLVPSPTFNVLLVGDDSNGSNDPTGLTIYKVAPNNQFIPYHVVAPVTYLGYVPVPPQPNPPKVPGLTTDMGYTQSVIRGNSLWVTQTRAISSSYVVIRWYEIDISGIITGADPNIPLTIKQSGDIIPPNGVSSFYGVPNIDNSGNVAIGFTVCGLKQAPTFSYTGRLAGDPLNTLRSPYIIPIPNKLQYVNKLGATSKTRWGDYSAMEYDPSENKFYFYSEYPQQNKAFVKGSISFAWTTGLVKFRINFTPLSSVSEIQQKVTGKKTIKYFSVTK